MDQLINDLKDLAHKDLIVFAYLNKINKELSYPSIMKDRVQCENLYYMVENLIDRNKKLEEMILTHMQKCTEINNLFKKD